MERDLKRTQRFTERDLGKDEQIQELKNENAELRKQSMVDKKTNNCLREVRISTLDHGFETRCLPKFRFFFNATPLF